MDGLEDQDPQHVPDSDLDRSDQDDDDLHRQQEEACEAEAQALIEKLRPLCTLWAFQLESAPTTGYRHYQGCCEFMNKRRKAWILKNVHPFEYLAPSKGSPKQNWSYCTKADTRLAGPWTEGEPTAAESGAQQVTELFVRAIEAGASDTELWREYPGAMARLPGVSHRIRSLKVPVRTKELEVYVLYGAAGTGKSRLVQENFPDVYKVPYARTGLWLTARACESKIILLEDFDGNLPLKQFNRLVDRYPEEVECKNGHLWWLPDVIFITTNTLPSHWYPTDSRQDVKSQIFRRITSCFDFNDDPTCQSPLTCAELCSKYVALYPVFVSAGTRPFAPTHRSAAASNYYFPHPD